MIIIYSFCIGFSIGWVIGRITKILKKRNAFDMTIVPEEEINDDDEPAEMA
jgi:hypothetical protein